MLKALGFKLVDSAVVSSVWFQMGACAPYSAERMNSRASMVGWWSLLLLELVAGKGILEIMVRAVNADLTLVA